MTHICPTLSQVRDNVTLWFFDHTDRRLLFRHQLNGRQQDAIVDSYAKSIIMEQGLVSGVRGAAWTIEQADGTFKLITFGTLSSAVYQLIETGHREHPMVQHALATGIVGSVVLHSKTPIDVIAWLRDYHNTFHCGSSYSFVELYVVLASGCVLRCSCPCCEQRSSTQFKRISSTITTSTYPCLVYNVLNVTSYWPQSCFANHISCLIILSGCSV